MSLGLLWTAIARIPSLARMNLKSVLVGSGTDIENIGDTSLQGGMIASVLSDSSSGGLKQNKVYQRNSTNTAWLQVNSVDHNHSGVDDGGSLTNVLRASSHLIWCPYQLFAPTHEQFFKTGTGATYSNFLGSGQGYVLISTGTTANNSGNLVVAGLLYDFAVTMRSNIRCRLTNNTSNYTGRYMFNGEYTYEITNNTNKWGIEACPTCDASGNVTVVSANGGSQRTKVSSTNSANNDANYNLRLNPSVSVVYQKDSSIITKTTDVPASGTPDRDRLLVMGIQTTDTIDKQFRLFGGWAVGTISEQNWLSI